MELQERFWSKVNKTESCWLWIGNCNLDGYGLIQVEGKSKLAHRVSWELFKSPIPDGFDVLHKCDIRNCIRDAHLYLGTDKENARDMILRGRGGSTKLTKEQVKEIRSSLLSCSKLGKLYGVHPTTISNIRTFDTWKF